MFQYLNTSVENAPPIIKIPRPAIKFSMKKKPLKPKYMNPARKNISADWNGFKSIFRASHAFDFDLKRNRIKETEKIVRTVDEKSVTMKMR